jgi:signal transduction histidine kinase
MKLSFKFKIAVISFAVSGALLTAFGVVFFAFIYHAGIERMDHELSSLVQAQLHGGHPTGHWRDFGDSLQFIYGSEENEQVAIRVTDAQNELLFESENIPSEIQALALPALPTFPLLPPLPPQSAITLLDRNQDGTIDPYEFDGPPHAFEDADTNGDGMISPLEARTLEVPPHQKNTGRKELPKGEPHFLTLKTENGNWRVGQFTNSETALTAAIDMGAFYAQINRFRNAFFISVAIGLLLLALTSWFLSARAMRPVAIIAHTTEGITAKGLDRRIPMVGTDAELERLVTVVNNMLDRLEKSYHQAVRFSADAAHELQTPLTILQGELDNAIQTSENGSTEQQRYSMLLDELRNLKAVVQKLLLLAHADEGRLKLNRQTIDLSELIRDAAEDLEMMAPELNLETHIPDDISASVDPALLTHALRNMTSNAAKYTDPKKQAFFSLEQDKNAIHFTLANTAPPIPDEDRPLLFERFHRVEKSRTTSGSGLGLSLAREIARAHGGDLILNPHAADRVSFTLTLPRLPL